MKLAFKVLSLIILIAVGKWEKDNHLLVNKRTESVYSPVYTHNTRLSENPKVQPGQEIQKISVNYNNY